MLDSSQLDHIEGRLTALSQKLESLAEKKAKISEDPEKDKMVLFYFLKCEYLFNIYKYFPDIRTVRIYKKHRKYSKGITGNRGTFESFRRSS